MKSLTNRISLSTPIHPILFAIIPIMFIFSNNVNEVSSEELIVPIIISIFISLTSFVILSKILKNSKKAGLIISVGLIIFFSYGHFHNVLLDDTIEDFDIGRHRFLLWPFLGIFVTVSYFLIKKKSNLSNATMITNVVALSLVIMPTGNALFFEIQKSDVFEDSALQEPVLFNNNQSNPDIYFIILDGYAGKESLSKLYNYDNSEFLSKLRNIEFFIPPKSYSNYPNTLLSLASTLNMNYLENLSQKVKPDHKDVSLTHKMIDNNQVMKIFKANGYKIINIDSGWEPSGKILIADQTECENIILSRMLTNLIITSMLYPITFDLLAEAKRDQVKCAFEQLENIHKEKDNQPVFVFTHFLIPHPPYLFNSEGSVDPESLDLESYAWSNKEGYIGQVQFVNKKIIGIVEKIISNSDTSPIFIIQSDHGSRFLDNLPSSSESIQEQTDILNALYNVNIAKQDPNNFDPFTSVNTFRYVLNSNFGTNFEILDNRINFPQGGPFNFTDVTQIIMPNN